MSTYSTRSQLCAVKAWGAAVTRIESANTVSHYFDKATVRGFGNLWHGLPLTTPNSSDGLLYFVESTKDSVTEHPRQYQVKSVDRGGRVVTVSEWPHYPSESEALAAARFVAGVK